MDTKKLRQKILDLAIRGKLVPQNPNDEPASVLLERIRAEKEQLIKEGKIKRSKKSVASDTSHYENVPFEVPESWCWVKVADISSVIAYGVSESAKSEGKFKLLRISDIQDNVVNWNTVPYTDYPESKSENYILQAGDILFARTGATVGKSYIVDETVPKNAIYASYLIKVRVSDMISPRYVKYFFESGFYWEQIANNSVGVGQPNVNGGSLGNLWVPIPPIREQRRIVDKLESWCLIIDKISVNQELMTKQVGELRSHILDLALSGKLVPQETCDEPAKELLKRINPIFSPTDNRHYANVPETWEVVALKDVTEIITGSTPSKSVPAYYSGDVPFYKPNDLDQGRHVRTASEHLSQQGKEISRSIPSNSIAVCCIGSIGKCGYIEHEGVTNQQINTIIPNEAIFPLYLFYFCNSTSFIDKLKSQSSAVTIPIVNKSKLSTIQIPLPPISEQKRIVNAIETILHKLDIIVGEIL